MIGGEGRRGGKSRERRWRVGGRGTAAIGHERWRKGEEGGRERKGERKREGEKRKEEMEVRRGRREGSGKEGNSCNWYFCCLSDCSLYSSLETVLPYSCLLASVCRLVTVTGTKESVCKAFDAIGKKIDQVSFIWNMSCIHH